MNEETKEVYEEVYRHLVDSNDELYKAGFENSLLYRTINCLIGFLADIL